ncbi:MAG: thymidine kinase [Bdellovibrionales bacterium]
MFDPSGFGQGFGPYGSIEVICGCMFSGKTEELLRRLQRAKIARQKIQIFKPTIDDRYEKEFVVSHNQNKILSTPVAKAQDILRLLEDSTRVVGVDEAQFFDPFIVEAVERMSNRGLRVLVAGLDMDYLGQPFGMMPQLMALAESVTKLSAICSTCGMPATRTQRMGQETGQVIVGASGLYEARCRRHHHVVEAMITSPPVRTSIENSASL